MAIKLFPLFILFSACARFEFVPLKSDGVKRITQGPKESPHFYVTDFRPSRVERKVASANQSEVNDQLIGKDLSNKQFYFFTLLLQYKAFNSVLGEDVDIASCPQFHNELLIYQHLLQDPNSYTLKHNFEQVLVSEHFLASFPVLALPYKGADIYSVWKQKQDLEIEQSILQAMIDFNQRNFKELNELCQLGASDNYYIFENLVQHHIDSEELRKDDALHILLKLPVFANMLVLDGLKDNQLESPLDKTLLERGRLGWFRNYLYKLRENRNNVGKFSTYRSLDEKRNLSLTHFTY